MSNVISIQDHQQRVWQEYTDAVARAEKTHCIEDGIAAGKAWKKWLSLFMSSDQRDFTGDNRRHSA